MNSQTPDSTKNAEANKEMGLLDHLHELRKRLVYIVIAVSIGTIIAFLYSNQVFHFLTLPFSSSFSASQLIGTGPAEAFILKLKVAVGAGIILVGPFIFLQLWLFIAPGLYPQEKKLAFPFIFFTTALFFVGFTFAYQVVLPFALDFFKSEYESIGVTPAIRIGELLPMMIKLLIAFGFIFNTPVLAYFLGRLGIISDKFLIKYFRHAVLAIFVISAVLTPPDVITQCLMAVPLVILYMISIAIVKFTSRSAITDNQPDK